jgi:methylase of polypeptide subunit release factors
VQRILGRQYHAVVGNPPYIVVKDAALNAAYRKQYASCHMKYSLGAPFTERFFELALHRVKADSQAAGFVGLITANSFMKREFGDPHNNIVRKESKAILIDSASCHGS